MINYNDIKYAYFTTNQDHDVAAICFTDYKITEDNVFFHFDNYTVFMCKLDFFKNIKFEE